MFLASRPTLDRKSSPVLRVQPRLFYSILYTILYRTLLFISFFERYLSRIFTLGSFSDTVTVASCRQLELAS